MITRKKNISNVKNNKNILQTSMFCTYACFENTDEDWDAYSNEVLSFLLVLLQFS